MFGQREMASSPPAPLQAFWAKIHPTNKGRQAIQVMVSFPSSIRTLQWRSGFSFRNSSYPRQGRLFQKQCCKAVKSLCTRTYSFQPFGHEYHTSWFGAQYITKFLYPIHISSVCAFSMLSHESPDFTSMVHNNSDNLASVIIRKVIFKKASTKCLY